MSKLPPVLQNMSLPVIGSPLFIISNPKLVIEQCKAGVVGSMPALNARPAELLDEWLAEITETLAAYNKANPDKPAAPFAINQIVHKSNDRLDHDLEMCVKYKVPVIITSLGARPEVNQAVHSYGGVVLHDVINNTFARKAIDLGSKTGPLCRRHWATIEQSRLTRGEKENAVSAHAQLEGCTVPGIKRY